MPKVNLRLVKETASRSKRLPTVSDQVPTTCMLQLIFGAGGRVTVQCIVSLLYSWKFSDPV
eukprot:scaffold18962_cov140-Skeletonema_marinoi.AAC.12